MIPVEIKEDSFFKKWKNQAKKLRWETYSLYLAYKDPRTPWFAKVFTGLVVAYAFSPIDLIPDFIPVLGYLDDLILVPLGVRVAVKMIPSTVMTDCRAKAQAEKDKDKPVSWITAGVIVLVWVVFMVLCVRWVWGIMR